MEILRPHRWPVRLILLGASLALGLGGVASADPSAARCSGGDLPAALSGYGLTFDEEFGAAAWAGLPPNATWQTKYFWGERTLRQNGETQFYSDGTVGANPFSGHDGMLDIAAAPGGNVAGLPYNSGIITSYRSFAQTYGYFEMRARLPRGSGMWPAFWLLPRDGQAGEIDIMEAFGAPNAKGEGGANRIHWANHFDLPSDMGDWVTVPADIYSGCHSYGADWEPDTITWYFDGQPIARVATPVLANNPMYILANLAVGGTWPGPAAGESAHMEISSIRVYRRVDP